MAVVNLRPAIVWTCPSCKHDNIVHLIGAYEAPVEARMAAAEELGAKIEDLRLLPCDVVCAKCFGEYEVDPSGLGPSAD